MLATATVEHELTVRLSPGGKLPRVIYCANCFHDARRVPFRLGVYHCLFCHATTYLDQEELKEMGIM